MDCAGTCDLRLAYQRECTQGEAGSLFIRIYLSIFRVADDFVLVRNEILFKWAFYGVMVCLCMSIQGLILQRMHIWGVIPFMYPLLAVIPATFEPPVFATSYAIALGVACDLLLPGSLPCFYTLTFPIAALFSSLLAQEWLPAGILCSLIVSLGAFALNGAFHCFILWASGKAAWHAGAYVALREFCVSVPLAIPLTPFFHAVSERTKPEDTGRGSVY